jgi:3-hydroxybutyryl-CoA dehydratase
LVGYERQDMAEKISCLSIGDLKEGNFVSFEDLITETDIDSYAALSGDYSTLHMEEEFAKGRGFRGRVVHGGFLIGLLSRLVGMKFPGENAVLQSMNIQFISPAYIGDLVRVRAEVNQISEATKTIVLKAFIENCATEAKLVRGKIQVGFTR